LKKTSLLTNGEMGLVAINPRMTIVLPLLNNWKYIPRNNRANKEGRLLGDLRWTLRLLKLLHLLHRVTVGKFQRPSGVNTPPVPPLITFPSHDTKPALRDRPPGLRCRALDHKRNLQLLAAIPLELGKVPLVFGDHSSPSLPEFPCLRLLHRLVLPLPNLLLRVFLNFLPNSFSVVSLSSIAR